MPECDDWKPKEAGPQERFSFMSWCKHAAKLPNFLVKCHVSLLLTIVWCSGAEPCKDECGGMDAVTWEAVWLQAVGKLKFMIKCFLNVF